MRIYAFIDTTRGTKFTKTDYRMSLMAATGELYSKLQKAVLNFCNYSVTIPYAVNQ